MNDTQAHARESSSGEARGRLSDGAEQLAAWLGDADATALHCDVLVVGSGYGGAVAAARLAGAKDAGGHAPTVWLLERGIEHLPGSFPARFGELPGQVRFSRQDGRPARGYLHGVFDVRLGDDVNVLVGNGLGGGSLINAGVMARPDPGVFKDRWPAAIDPDALEEAFQRAGKMLEAATVPQQAETGKLHALDAMASDAAGATAQAERCAIAVSFADKASVAHVPMNACTRCGDCITGCNVGAKRTLDTNYLATARAAGARLFCGGWVERIEPRGRGGWRVFWHYTDADKRAPGDVPFVVNARRVVLAAGSLGSTEILLRSAPRLRCSQRLGAGFSTNGDQIAAAWRQRVPVKASRDEDVPAWHPHNDVGPTITGLVRTQSDGHAIAVEEFAVPAPMRRVMGEVTTSFGLLQALFAGSLELHEADSAAGEELLGVTTSSLAHTSIVGMMGDDGAAGTIALHAAANGAQASDGLVEIHWDDKRRPEVEALAAAQFGWVERACGATAGGTAVPNPAWRVLPAALADIAPPQRGAATTVHPLGGCAIGTSAADGVVDACGRVFDGVGGVHDGLVVLDGSIVPRALGVNPALTIAALAEHATFELAKQWWGLTLDDKPPAAQAVAPHVERRIEALAEVRRLQHGLPHTLPAPSDPTVLQIGERMTGTLNLGGAGSTPLRAELEIQRIEIPRAGALLRRGSGRLKIAEGQLTLRDAATQAQWTLPVSGSVMLLLPGESGGAAAIIDVLAVVLERLRARLASPSDDDGAKARDALQGVSVDQKSMELVAGLAQALRIDYRLDVGTPKTGSGAQPRSLPGLPSGSQLLGRKTLVFSESGNPWRQLMRLEMVREVPGGEPQRLGVLNTDVGWFARFRHPLLTIVRQHDHASALADVVGFLLLMLRALLLTQLPHFIPPGDMPLRIGERWPGTVDGRRPRVYKLDLGARLSRYLPDTDPIALPPVLLIHGLGAAGSTFTHPSIPGNLASFLLQRGRDVWVLDLSTSAANEPPRHGPYSFEEVALRDIPAAVDAIVQARHGGTVDVVAHCIGAAMFSLAVLQRPGLHRSIGRAVLSQVGPLSEMSPFNRVRGYFASFLENYLEVDELDVRPDWRFDAVTQKPVRDKRSHRRMLLDALLTTFPYADDDHEAARVKQTLTAAGGGDFRLVRHRADAIYGQTMQIDNVAHDTLLALDALFGWVKTRTMAQTIHLARQGVLTNADGINEGLSSERVAERMAFPVLLLHGERNAMFEVRGSRRSYELLKSVFNEPVGGNSAADGGIHLGAGTPRQLRVIRGYGHQDVFIGKNARCDVFPVIDAFLAQPSAAPTAQRALVPSRFGCEAPWMGPMLGWLQRIDHDKVSLALLVHAGGRQADVLCVVLVPAEVEAGGKIQLDIGAAIGRRIGPVGASVSQRQKLLEEPLCIVVDRSARNTAWLVLLLHRELQDPLAGADDFLLDPGRRRSQPNELAEPFALAPEALQAVRRHVAAFPPRENQLLVLKRAQLAAADHDTGKGQRVRPLKLRFALGSCQYAQGLFDKPAAEAAFVRLHQLARGGNGGGTPPAFMLALGDQVYLDAMANVFDVPGAAADDIARRAYELTWRLPGFRAMAARLPLYAMFDDHEVIDNWRPGATDAGRVAAGLAAWQRYQGKLNPPRIGNSYSFRFAPGGLPIFVLDTRSQRELRCAEAQPPERGQVPIDMARIVPHDWQVLKDWLLEHHGHPVKFIASPSGVLPIERVENVPLAERLGCDSWAGFPASLVELLHFIDENAITGVVFLCGDAHMSSVSQLRYGRGNNSVVRSIVSSGLYAPWTFTNGRPQDTLPHGSPVRIMRSNDYGPPLVINGQLDYIVEPTTRPRFALIDVVVEVGEAGSKAGLGVEFHDADGVVERSWFDLEPPAAGAARLTRKAIAHMKHKLPLVTTVSGSTAPQGESAK